MPSLCGYYYSYGYQFRKEAERQVRAKFPDLPEGSSGWWRAVENRFKRLLSTCI